MEGHFILTHLNSLELQLNDRYKRVLYCSDVGHAFLQQQQFIERGEEVRPLDMPWSHQERVNVSTYMHTHEYTPIIYGSDYSFMYLCHGHQDGTNQM